MILYFNIPEKSKYLEKDARNNEDHIDLNKLVAFYSTLISGFALNAV